jgi:starch-binding outer membrane protein, SusD/RagB family
MKSRNKFFIAVLAVLVLLLPRCSKKLEEQPYTVFTVDYFKTPSGFQNGVYALYSGMRFLYGPEGAVNIGCAGTDEWSMGGEVRRQVGSDLYTLCDYSMDNNSGAILTPWNRSFNNINLANGLLEYAKDVAIPDAAKNVLLGEIRFLRGLYYFNLIQYFGAVPLDLGSGDLKFNQKPFQGFNRLPTPGRLHFCYTEPS